MNYSNAFLALWAKKSEDTDTWLPLHVHLSDTAEIAKLMWNEWIPESAKRIMAKAIDSDTEKTKQLFIFFAVCHDIGKATPFFQATQTINNEDLDQYIKDRILANGLTVKDKRSDYRNSKKTQHGTASLYLLNQAKENGLSKSSLALNAAVVLACHHGKTPELDCINHMNGHKANIGVENEDWKKVQAEIISFALTYSGYETLSDIPAPTMQTQVVFSGFVSIADWIASGILPLVPSEQLEGFDPEKRAEEGWKNLGLPDTWNPYVVHYGDKLYSLRFKDIKTPNNMQKVVAYETNKIQNPGIMIIEAKMGDGKTEAGLVAAEIFRNKTNAGGLDYFLPTQATSNSMYDRLDEWGKKLGLINPAGVKIAHAKGEFIEDDKYQQWLAKKFESEELDGQEMYACEEDDTFIAANQWFIGSKKSLLSPFAVGTIDQLLMSSLRQKYVTLKWAGLVGKIVIIDEIHAYDAFMNVYLKRTLAGLGSLGIPVICLSATLPTDTRRDLINAYLRGKASDGEWSHSREYPLITYSDGNTVKSVAVNPEGVSNTVSIKKISFEAVVDTLDDLLSDGGCAGIIVDTVKRAQSLASKLRKHFLHDITVGEMDIVNEKQTEIIEVHAQYVADSRISKENRILGLIGKKGSRPLPPKKLIVIGTQVLEQSLNIDFDVLITDIAPIDLLFQRLGRLHRHSNLRPPKLQHPTCYIIGIEAGGDFDIGIKHVYDVFLLSKTVAILDNKDWTLVMPEDIPVLINELYQPKTAQATTPKPQEEINWEQKTLKKQNDAEKHCLGSLNDSNDNLLGWLNKADNTQDGVAAVRDSYNSVEVLIVKKTQRGYALLNGKNLPTEKLSDKLAKEIARQYIYLPKSLNNNEGESIIDKLEKSNEESQTILQWKKSHWLSKALILVLDENSATVLNGNTVNYSMDDGLIVTKNT